MASRPELEPTVVRDATLAVGPDRGSTISVLVDGGTIAEVCPAGRDAPRAAQVVDGRGLFLIPGLVDAHCHALTPWARKALLQSGVTSIRNPAAPDPATGRAMGEPGPHVLSAGRPIDGAPSVVEAAVEVRSETEARQAVRAQAEAGADLIKLYTRLSPELTRAVIQEAHGLGLPVLGDLGATSWTEAARAGIDGLCHGAPICPGLLSPAKRGPFVEAVDAGMDHPYLLWLEHVDLAGAEITEMIEVLAELEVTVEPTLAMLEAALRSGDPDFRLHAEERSAHVVPDRLRQRVFPREGLWGIERCERGLAAFERARDLVSCLHEGGVTLLAGSDSPRHWLPPGESLHRELELLVGAGLTAVEALAAATSGAASSLGRPELASLRQGARADFVLVREDPGRSISAIRTVELVMQGGVVAHGAGGARHSLV